MLIIRNLRIKHYDPAHPDYIPLLSRRVKKGNNDFENAVYFSIKLNTSRNEMENLAVDDFYQLIIY